MGISDWVKSKREEYQANKDIKEARKAQARMEAEEINKQKIAERQRQLLEESRQKELEKLTTPTSERLMKGAKKVGDALQQAGGKASSQLSQLGTDVKIESGNVQKVSQIANQEIIPKQTTPIKQLLSQDNISTPIGSKIFGNSFTQDKKLVGGFSNSGLDKEKIKKLI